MAENLQMCIKSKLIIMLLAMSLGAIIVLGYLSWRTSRNTVTESVFNHLTSVRASKAYHMETYMHFLREQVAVWPC